MSVMIIHFKMKSKKPGKGYLSEPGRSTLKVPVLNYNYKYKYFPPQKYLKTLAKIMGISVHLHLFYNF